MIYTKQKGFTLIELMIVVAIVGILAAIAIPQFESIRSKAFDAAAMADMTNGITAIQGFQTDYGVYPDTHALAVSPSKVTLTSGADTLDWVLSDGIAVLYEKGATVGYCLISKHQGGEHIYVSNESIMQPIPLTAIAPQGVELDSPGAVVGTKDCSGMGSSALAAISAGN